MGSRDTREVPKPHNTLSVNDRAAFCFSQTQVISNHNYFFSHLREGREKPHGALIMGFRPVLTVARLAPPVDLKDQARPPVEAQQPFSRRGTSGYFKAANSHLVPLSSDCHTSYQSLSLPLTEPAPIAVSVPLQCALARLRYRVVAPAPVGAASAFNSCSGILQRDSRDSQDGLAFEACVCHNISCGAKSCRWINV